jgi:hypothetical protein
MKEGSNTNLPIDADDFIRQVLFTGSSENVPESKQQIFRKLWKS